MKHFNILLNDFNTSRPEVHDIMPYLMQVYKLAKDQNFWSIMPDPNKAPKTIDEWKHFIKQECIYRYWARCEYEWIMVPWPYRDLDDEKSREKFKKEMHKIDAWKQIEMNLDVVVDLFLENINEKI